jgi:hypothetical protein
VGGIEEGRIEEGGIGEGEKGKERFEGIFFVKTKPKKHLDFTLPPSVAMFN